MRKTRLTLLAVLGLAALSGAAGVFALTFPLVCYVYADPIERAEIDTRLKLWEYERSGDASGLGSWILSHDGAPFTAACYTLGGWAMSHPREFLTFLDSLDAKQGPIFALSFLHALSDEEAFRSAFRGYHSQRLSAVLGRSPDPGPWIAPKARPRGG